jgi:hypothetical protein
MTGNELNAKLLAYCAKSETERRALWAELYALVRENFDVDQTKLEIRRLVESVGTHARGAGTAGAALRSG